MAKFMDVCRSAVAFCLRARSRWLELLAAILLLCGTFTIVHAGYERYDYDSVGRLIRVIDERGRITEFRYDGVGNILQVINGEVGTQAPAITSVTPSVIRRGETKQVVIAGSNLTGVAVGTSAVGLGILDVRSTTTQVTLKLVASNSAALGQQSIQLSSAAGTATATITVAPVAPKLYVDPVPLAVPPDNIGRQITLRLSNADATDHAIGLAATNGNIAVTPAQVTIPAGQTSANVSITGKTAGQSVLNLTSVTLGNTSVPVYVTGEFAGMGTSHARALGVMIAEGAATAPTVSPVLSRALGVAIGNFVSGMSPSSFAIGSGPTVLTVAGSGLNGAASVTLNPPTGITVGVPAPAADGRSFSVPLTVAADAPLGVRQVTVSDATGNRFAVTHPQADRIEIVLPGPEIDSIDPLHAQRGSVVAMTIRGRNLQGLQAEILPATGLAFGADPVLNAEGTEARVQLGVGVDAPVGEYLVVAKTPGGSSSTTKTGSNTFRVVNELLGVVTPISSRPLGVVVHDNASANNAQGLHARPLGVAVGSIIGAVSPATGMIGSTVTLTLQGSDLGAVSSVQLTPNTGLNVGSIVPAADGKSVSVQVSIAADAPLEVRRITVMAGATAIPFAHPDGDQFKVTAPMPEIASMSPIVMQIGQSAQSLTIRGRNLQGATAVTVQPSDGIAISTPSVNASGTEISVSVSIAANVVPGQRAVTVVTPAGQSDSALMAANTLTLASNVPPAYTPVTSPALGVLVMSDQVAQTVLPVISAPLGIVLQDAAAGTAGGQVMGGPLGVVVGSAATALEPTGFLPGESGVLLIRGVGLDKVTSIGVTPGEGITLDTPIPAADGNSLLVSVTVAADALALAPRRVRLFGASEEILFVGGVVPQIVVGPGVPTIDSITPIVVNQGDKVSMTIRGTKLLGANAVTVTPPDGITVSNALTVDAAGTEMTVDIGMAADAAPGSRVLQVWVPGASTTNQPVPANTFTINPR